MLILGKIINGYSAFLFRLSTLKYKTYSPNHTRPFFPYTVTHCLIFTDALTRQWMHGGNPGFSILPKYTSTCRPLKFGRWPTHPPEPQLPPFGVSGENNLKMSKLPKCCLFQLSLQTWIYSLCLSSIWEFFGRAAHGMGWALIPTAQQK